MLEEKEYKYGYVHKSLNKIYITEGLERLSLWLGDERRGIE